MLYPFFRILAVLFRILPRRLVQALGSSLCLLAALCRPRLRRTVRDNLAVVLASENPSPQRLRRLVYATFRNFGAYLADFIRFRRADALPSHNRLRVENPRLLDVLRTAPRGALAVTLHLGNWELAGACLAAAGIPVHAVVRPVHSLSLERIFTRFRQQRGIALIPLDHAPLGIARTLRAGGTVALLGDRDYSAASPLHPFFDRPARLPRGPAALAARFRIPLLFGAVARDPDNAYTLRLSLIPPDPSLSEADIQAHLTALMQAAIRQNPDQWYAFRPFWPPSP